MYSTEASKIKFQKTNLTNLINLSTLRDIINHGNPAKKIIDLALGQQAGMTWKLTGDFCDTTGARYVGSEGNKRAVELSMEYMKKAGFENVRTQNLMVRNWKAKNSYVMLSSPYTKKLLMLPLGGSVSTKGEMEGDVIVVKDFGELNRRSSEVKGKIVVFNQVWVGYGRTVVYRSQGAIEAAKHGAIGVLVKSITPFSLATPHTGTTSYHEDIPKIPIAAITVEDAKFLARLEQRNVTIKVKFNMEIETGPDISAPNVIGEIIGSKYPNEIVVIGGHLDTWDLGQGAMDDAGGMFVCFQAMRLLKILNLRPKRTIRLVWWNAEEIGGFPGAHAYANKIRPINRNHVIAFESDAGTFTPSGFGFTGLGESQAIITEIGRRFLSEINAGGVFNGGSSPDLGPLEPMGIPVMNIRTQNEKYFWYHHTDADMIDLYNPKDMDLCSASIAVMFYTIADLEQKLPRAY